MILTSARDDVPLLGRADDDLRLHDLLASELVVAGQLVHFEFVRFESFRKVASHFGDQGPHRRHVDDLERLAVDRSVLVRVLADLAQDRQQGHVGLAWKHVTLSSHVTSYQDI